MDKFIKPLLRIDKEYSEKLYRIFKPSEAMKKLINIFTRGYGALPIIIIIFLFEENKLKFVLFTFLYLVIVFILVENILKRIVNRKRPEYSELNTRSFPSSHAVTMFGATTIYILTYQQHQFWVIFSIYLIVYSLSVSLSRVILGYHFLSDIIAGAIIGISLGLVIVFGGIY